MLRKFNEDTIYSKFIKALIADTYIPTLEIWKPGKPIIKNFQYITKNYIVEAKKSWTLNSTDKLDSIMNSNYFKIIRPYIEGEYYRNVTSNYISNSLEYDDNIHYYLGQYLRSLRDLHNIDLMSYYNCINCKELERIRIDCSQTNFITQNSKGENKIGKKWTANKIITDHKGEDNYKVLSANIYFNQDYTIYIESDSPVILSTIYYDEVNYISSNILDTDIKYLDTSRKTKPILYRINQNISEGFTSGYKKNYLTLLLQVPKHINNIVILEGDYTKNKSFVKNNKNQIPKVIYGKSYNELTEEEINNYCKVIPSLINSNKNELYAYDDILIEYLLKNVIYNLDEIHKNIERVQEYASSSICEKYNSFRWKPTLGYTKGIWSNDLRAFVYNLLTDRENNPKLINANIYNINGYIDKNAESIITRGQNV